MQRLLFSNPMVQVTVYQVCVIGIYAYYRVVDVASSRADA